MTVFGIIKITTKILKRKPITNQLFSINYSTIICLFIFEDKLSGKDTNRPEFQKLLEYVRQGEIVVVTELDRLGRNNKERTETMNLLKNKSVTIEILNLPSFKDIQDENLRNY